MSRHVKSGNGQGGVRVRADRRLEARYSIVVDGKTERRSVFGKSKREITQKLREALTARDRGLVANVSAKTTVQQYLDEWISGIESTLRPRTAASYRGSIRNYIVPAIGRVPLARLQPQHISRMYGEMQARGLSPKTIRNTGLVLHRAVEQARRWAFVPLNVVDLVDLPRVVRHEMQALDGDEVARILEAARDDEDGLEGLWWLGLTGGFRQGELIALRWSEVDLESGSVRVVASMVRLSGQQPRLVEPKTRKSRRQVSLSRGALEVLRRHRQQQAETSLAAGHPIARDAFVFQRRDGRPMAATTLWKRWRRLLTRAQVRPVRFHDARHTAATLLLSRGVHPKVVSEMLGHATVAMTLDVYSHVTPTMSKQAANVMDDLFTAGRSG